MCLFRPHIHREKRKFLRTALKELAVVFTDQPGLLGPKVLTVIVIVMMLFKSVSGWKSYVQTLWEPILYTYTHLHKIQG